MYQQLRFFSSNLTFILSGLSFAYNKRDKGRLTCICTGRHLDRRIENDATRRLAAPDRKTDQREK